MGGGRRRGDVAGWESTLGRWAVDLHGGLTPVLEVGDAVPAPGWRPLVVAALLAVVAGWRWRATAVVLAGFGAWGIAQWAKDAVDRPRPTAAALGRKRA